MFIKKRIIKLSTVIINIPKALSVRFRLYQIAKRKKMTSVVFEITTTNEFFYLKPLIEGLPSDIYFVVVTSPIYLIKPLKKLLKNVSNKKIILIDSFWNKYWGILDFYINASLTYDLKVPLYAKHRINLPHTITSKKKYDIFSNLIEKFTDIFATGNFFIKDLENYIEDHKIQTIPVIHNIGCPKSDDLFSKVDKKYLLKKYGLDPNLPTLLFAPTWNKDSSAFTWIETMLLLSEKFMINVIIKLHPGMYITDSSIKLSGGINWKKLLDETLKNKKRTFNALNIDSADLVKVSDITITDISTIWIEFYLLRKKIIFLNIPTFINKNETNSLGEFWNKYGKLVENSEELYNAINEIINNKPWFFDSMPRIDNDLLFNMGRAQERAISAIHKLRIN